VGVMKKTNFQMVHLNC